MKKRVLYLITKSEPYGGAQRYTYDLASSLSKDLFDVAVASGGEGTLVKKLKKREIQTIPIISLARDINIGKEMRSFFEIFKIIREYNPDILHLSSSKASGLGALAARIHNTLSGGPKNKIKIVFTVHGWPFGEDRSFLAQSIIKFFSWLTALLSHHVIILSKRDMHHAKNLIGIGTKATLIYNGIEKFEVLEKNNARGFLRNRLGLSDNGDTLWLGTISELHKNKGLTYLIDALKKIENDNFIFIVIGEGEERTRLTEKIKKLGLEKKIFLLGYLEDARSYLGAFDITTLTSVKEGLPYTLLEAGLAKNACIASCVGGIPDIISDMKNGILVKPRQSSEIARGLTYLIQNPMKRNEFGEELKRNIENQFSAASMREKTIALYRC